MNLPTKYVSGIANTGEHIKTLKWHDGEHCPDNKRPGEVESLCELEIKRCTPNDSNDGWLQVSMLEITTSPHGRVSSRTITTVISRIEAERIANFVLTGE